MTESDSEYQFVELNRTFHELSKYASEDDERDLSHAFHVGDRLKWSDLVQQYRLIVLSEAGSGKTAEIRNIARELRTQGKPAFFIRLEHIPNDFEDAFEVGTFEEFQQWVASGDEGWLLLDSVDEARLRDPGDFALAIRKLARRIQTAKDRTHVVITGRTNAWRPKTDLSLCIGQLPFTPTTTTVKENVEREPDDPLESFDTSEEPKAELQSTFKIVALDDLSRTQIEIFAKAHGVSDTRAFLEAIERADAWSFTSRPQDLAELTEFWIDQSRIGSRLEIMRNSIERRLTERDQDRADARPLAPQRARQAARLIAAATTLGQEPTIRVPDGAENSKGISLQAVLPDWDDKDRSTLLSRPIFDEAIYGTVRFHHRSVREYLAAEWFADLLVRETSRRKIESLFFRNQYGVDVVVPTLRPILPWLAILDDKIRERIRKVAPEIVFEGGDPSQLPLETRKIILHEVCEQLASGASGRSMTDYAAVQRFANSDLTEDVRSLFRKYASDDELQSFLLRMIWLGQLSGALPDAKEIALSASASRHTRIAAFRAVKAVGSPQDQDDVRRSFLTETSVLKRDWVAELIKEVTPSADTMTWLLDCLEKTEAKERYSVDGLSEAIVEFAQAADLDLLPEFVKRLNKLLNRPPVVERRYCEISQKFSWLMKGASLAVERLIQARHPMALDPVSLAILHKFGIGRDYINDYLDGAKTKFPTLVPAWVELKRALFWYEVGVARKGLDKKRSERLTEFWQVYLLEPFWRFALDDFDYVSDQISSQRVVDNKLVALSLAFRLYLTNGRPRPWREKLKKQVADNSELSERLGRYLNPPAQGKETRGWKRREAEWKRRSEARKRKEEKNRADWKKHLSENVEKLRDPGLTKPGQFSSAQYYLHEQMRGDGFRSGRWTQGNWQVLIAEHGDAVARAFRDGVTAYWRRNKPILRSEGAEANTTLVSTIFGLTGLEIEAKETRNWPKGLSEPEVEMACRYASFELNGFPTWFPKLFEMHPKLVGDFLLREIQHELSTEKPDVESHYILSDVSWSGEWAWNALGPSVFKILKAAEPRNPANLSRLLKIVQGSTISDGDIAKLASRKARTLRRLEHVAHWFAVWVGVDPEAAIPYLTAHFDKLTTAKDRTAFAMNFITHLWGGRRSETSRVRSAFQTPEHLKSLYLLMHEHIRRTEDIERAGKGVYSPGLRDNAQDSRNSLFELLNKIPGKEAFLALQDISRSHPEEASRPWFAHLAKKKAEQDAEIAPWAPSQVRDFHDKFERTPGNHRDLAELAIMRLLDLKDGLEHGDSSIAGILKGVALETDMRKYLGGELREKAFSRYVIPQEEELADAKKPDLRFHGVIFDGPVPAELKLADKWTGPDLFERLENQLCGNYLRDSRSSRGIFVLVHRGGKAGWDVPGSTNRVDFDGLVSALQNHWEQIAGRYPGVDEITLIGIDLTKRFS